MHIQNRIAKVIFSLIIASLAGIVAWSQFSSFGNDAWRLFVTWFALMTSIYYVIDIIYILVTRRKDSTYEFFPVMRGGLIVSGIALVLIRIICAATNSYDPSAEGTILLSELILPVLMIVAWVALNAKGFWRAYDPFYWLALPISFFAGILATSEFMPRTAQMIYPYPFLNYPSIGIDNMLLWLVIIAVVILAIGYIFWILDFMLSGKLSEHVVMPKIKTIVIEEIEEVIDDAPADEDDYEKPQEKPVKLVTTGSRNLPVEKAKVVKEKAEKPQAKKNKSEKPSAKEKEVEKPQAAKSQPKPERIIERIELDSSKVSKKSAEQETQESSAKSKKTQDLEAKESKENPSQESTKTQKGQKAPGKSKENSKS